MDHVMRNQVLTYCWNTVIRQISHQLGVESWEVFIGLDDVLDEIAKKSEERLALQGGEG